MRDYHQRAFQHGSSSARTHGTSRNQGKENPQSANVLTELQDLRDFVRSGWMQYSGLDGPTFLWNRLIPEISAQDDNARADAPVAPVEQARAMMMTPIEWYLHAVGATTASATPTVGGYDIPRADMPSFRMDSHALAGVNAVVGNALMSSRWIEATRNLALAARITSMFLGNIADRNDEALGFLKNLIQNVRVYFDALARNADPASAELSLQIITDAACSDSFRLNPAQMIELLSCCISFARWDDTRVLAYDALSRARKAMESNTTVGHYDSDSPGANETDDIDDDDDADDDDGLEPGLYENESGEVFTYADGHFKERFEQALLFLNHDLLRMSGDNEAADRFLMEHHDNEPMADAYAARLIAQDRWRDLLAFCETVLNDNPNQQLTMIPAQMVPYEWDSIREMALQALGRHRDLCGLYRSRIVEAYGREEIANVPRLRAVSGSDWPDQVRMIVREYDDGRGRFTRNPAYEHILITERMGTQAWRYCLQFPKARGKLAKTISLVNPDRAKTIVLGKINPDGTYQGELPARRVVYQGIADTLERYASAFGTAQARQIARDMVTHYPTRRTLAVELQEFLGPE